MFEFLGRYLLIAMEWLNDSLIHNYALSIILFTALLKLVTLPFDIKQRKSMMKMNGAQVELQRIQQRYANNPEVAQKKQMEYYKKNGINPYSGCLPIIITMLFFMIFLRSMTFWANMKSVELVMHPDTFSENQMLWVRNIWMPDSGMAGVVLPYEQFTKLPFDKLRMYFTGDELKIFNDVITYTEEQYNTALLGITTANAGYANGWFILPLLSGGSMILSQLYMMKQNPQQANTPGMGKGMMYAMAAMSVWFCITSNAAFALYWLMSNIYSFIVSALLFHVSKKAEEVPSNG